MKLIGIILVVSFGAYYAGLTINRYLAYPARLAAVYEAEMVRDAAHKFVRDRCVATGNQEWNTLTTAAELASAGYMDATRFGGNQSGVTGITWQLLSASHNFIRLRALNIADTKTLNILATRFPNIQLTPAVSGASIAVIAMPVNYQTGQIGFVDHQVFMRSEYDFKCSV